MREELDSKIMHVCSQQSLLNQEYLIILLLKSDIIKSSSKNYQKIKFYKTIKYLHGATSTFITSELMTHI